MNVLVVDGDGFYGWPTALHLSKIGPDVVIVEKLSRRKIDAEFEVDSLTSIAPMSTLLAASKETTGTIIAFRDIDVAQEYGALLDLIHVEKVDAILHLDEQRAATCSMNSACHMGDTVGNSLSVRHSIVFYRTIKTHEAPTFADYAGAMRCASPAGTRARSGEASSARRCWMRGRSSALPTHDTGRGRSFDWSATLLLTQSISGRQRWRAPATSRCAGTTCARSGPWDSPVWR